MYYDLSHDSNVTLRLLSCNFSCGLSFNQIAKPWASIMELAGTPSGEQSFTLLCSLSREERRHHALLQLIASQNQLQAEVESQKVELEHFSRGMAQLFAYMTQPFGDTVGVAEMEGSDYHEEQNESDTPRSVFHELRLPAMAHHSLHEVLQKLQVSTVPEERDKLVLVLQRYFLNSTGLSPSHALLFGSLEQTTFRSFLSYLMLWTRLLGDELPKFTVKDVFVRRKQKDFSVPQPNDEKAFCKETLEENLLPALLRVHLTPENRFFSLVFALSRLLDFWRCTLESNFFQEQALFSPDVRPRLRLSIVDLEEIFENAQDEVTFIDRAAPEDRDYLPENFKEALAITLRQTRGIWNYPIPNLLSQHTTVKCLTEQKSRLPLRSVTTVSARDCAVLMDVYQCFLFVRHGCFHHKIVFVVLFSPLHAS
eukprot:gene7609-5369_t